MKRIDLLDRAMPYLFAVMFGGGMMITTGLVKDNDNAKVYGLVLVIASVCLSVIFHAIDVQNARNNRRR